MDDIPSVVDSVGAALANELTCVGCGYDLRGLPSVGNCPECNTPVAQSSHGNQLRNSDPQWLERLRLGASVKLWNIVLTILTAVISVIVVGVLRFPQAITEVIGIATASLALWATFLITTQEPKESISEQGVTLRKIIRGCAVAGFVGSLLSGGSPAGAIGVGVGITVIIAQVSGVVATLGEFVYLSRAAIRIPDEKLAHSTRVVMWGTVGIAVLAFLGGLVGAIFFGATSTTTATASISTATTSGGLSGDVAVAAFGVGVCVLSIAGLVFMVWYVRLLQQYKRAFAEARDHAQLKQSG